MQAFILLSIFSIVISEKTEIHLKKLQKQTTLETSGNSEENEETVDNGIYFDELNVNDRSRKSPKIWDHWGKWSPCSVTCGVGKMTRWRHCVSEGCAPGEKEAQIKTCKKKVC